MIDKERFKHKAKQAGIEVEDAFIEKIGQYAEILAEWNEKINLTAIKTPEETEDKHFIDSLLLAKQPEIAGKMADVGSGAGFPGMVSLIYKPDLAVTLIEPTGKRVKFLQELAAALKIGPIILNERAEEVGHGPLRAKFDCVSARAVASLPVLCEYCLPLVKQGGVFIAMKADVDAELALSGKAIQTLGGRYRETRTYTLPDGSVRNLVVIDKLEETPAGYPRHNAKIKKKPL